MAKCIFVTVLDRSWSTHSKVRRILRPVFAIHLKFAALWIICVWTYDEFTRSIRFDPKSNNYILGEYLPECYSIFASMLNTLNLNHQFFALSTIRLKLQRFAIHSDNVSRSGTLLRRNLTHSAELIKNVNKYVPSWYKSLINCTSISVWRVGIGQVQVNSSLSSLKTLSTVRIWITD